MTFIGTARRWLSRIRNRFASRTARRSRNYEESSEDTEDSAENPIIDCNHMAEIEAKSGPEKLKNRAMIEASNDFAAKFLREFFASGSCMCISPISISFVLAMSLAGAKGETEAEILKLLGKGCSVKEVEAFFVDIKTVFQLLSELEILHDANRIYFDLSLQLLDTYKEKVTRLYGEDAFSLLDFKDSDGTVKKINSLVEEITKGNLKDVLTADQVRNCRMILLNALDFRGKWQTEFNRSENATSEFRLLNGTTKKAEFMTDYRKSFWCFYCENDEMQRICLPYKNGYLKEDGEWDYEKNKDVGEIAMYLFLPRKRKGLPKLVENLTGKKLLKWLRMMPLENYRQRSPTVCDIVYEVHIKVPKFTIRSDLHVEDALEKNGLEHYFTENADFSGATNARLQDFTHKSSFIHKTFIKTDECGTEASAVSYKTYHDYASMAPPKIPVKYVYKNFHANRPFLYAIVSRKQHVLFIGTVMDVDEKIEAEFEDTDVDENTNQI
ncbi:serpin (serine protease inhibitor) domain-containing protein [Ditylenchus destructor]|uniref:Serpin (Serine protease inhibitor) domain-containing protein n=1 Tax=Ditylenchus destructor TaxID=166010 RepID=A0AAD4MS01_9BILA|nr:serpin (serine protease inhibitor) domain-containing protein [Ditylenchus destructor]